MFLMRTNPMKVNVHICVCTRAAKSPAGYQYFISENFPVFNWDICAI